MPYKDKSAQKAWFKKRNETRKGDRAYLDHVGILQKERRRRMKTDPQVWAHYKLRVFKAQSKRRKLDWELTDEEAKGMLSSPCFYCGVDYGGIDRVDNDIGYMWHNTVPCCGTCNNMKGTLSVTAFKEKIALIAENIKSTE